MKKKKEGRKERKGKEKGRKGKGNERKGGKGKGKERDREGEGKERGRKGEGKEKGRNSNPPSQAHRNCRYCFIFVGCSSAVGSTGCPLNPLASLATPPRRSLPKGSILNLNLKRKPAPV